MKRIFKIFIIVVALVVATKIYAGTAYVDSINIDAKINDNGSMTVEETIVWNIEEQLNGVYRDILIENASNKLNGASDIQIHRVIVDGKEFNREYMQLLNGTSGKYNVNTIDGGKQVKIFKPSDNEYLTTCISYTLYDVVVKYNDIAELYWNFIGSGWDRGIVNVNINVTLPNPSKVLKVFGHGPLYGYTAITNANEATLQVGNLRGGEIVDMRLLFDASLVETSKVIEQNVLENILAEEAKLAEQANLDREKAKKVLCCSATFICIAIIIPIIMYVPVYKKAIKAKFKGKYYRELPEDYGPAVMSKLLYPMLGTASSNDMLATLLDLVRRKYVEIEPIIKQGKKKPISYRLKLIKTDLSELNKSEKYFVDNMIFVDTNEITLQELSKRNSKSIKAKNKAYKDFTNWSEIITDIAKEKDLIKKENIKVGKYILKCIPSVVLVLLVIIYAATNNYDDILGVSMLGFMVCIFESIFVCVKTKEINIRTQKGVEHKAMWNAFEKFLSDFSKLDEHEYKSIAIWEHYLVYATALGISKKVIEELKIVFPTEFENDMLSNYATIGLISDKNSFSNFSNSFTSAASTAFSAPSSSAGSGGGFSGGAGIGRWWWRRWRLLKFKDKHITRKNLASSNLAGFFLLYIEKPYKNRYNIAVKR